MSRYRKNAFATVMALVCLMLVSVTITGLMTRFAMQSRRTNQDLHRAQLEQIQIAKAIAGQANQIVLPNQLQLQFKDAQAEPSTR